jgi:hypothetical protein
MADQGEEAAGKFLEGLAEDMLKTESRNGDSQPSDLGA